MLTVEDWAEIRRLHRSEQLPIKVIARVMGISRNTVNAALASDGPPGYRRRSSGSIVDEVEPRIRELLQAYPRMPATVILTRCVSLPRQLPDRIGRHLAGGDLRLCQIPGRRRED